jgi:hypothetical protein
VGTLAALGSTVRAGTASAATEMAAWVAQISRASCLQASVQIGKVGADDVEAHVVAR